MQHDEKELLRHCRRQRDTIAGKAFLSLLKNRIEDGRNELVSADNERVPFVQGAVRELKELVALIEYDPEPKERKDGAYS